ncbi:MAG: DUF3152 domain-containing protein [Pseudonocardiaceae bacterium]|nr:DUF3152 domain-containing protein [Pseudonocardiaceae bacterium]
MREDEVRKGTARDGKRSSSAASASEGQESSDAGQVATARKADDRRGSGARRTSGEPLRASWRPAPSGERDRGQRNRGRLARFARTYGWRVYALPILTVITVLVAVDTASTGDDTPGGQQAATPASGEQSPGPQATEKRGAPVNLNIPTAKLPAGQDFTPAGKGSWHVVPGDGKKVGKGGEEFTYTVEVEDGLDPTSFGGEATFARMVDETLADKRSWIGGGQVSLRRVGPDHPDPSFRVSLTSLETSKRPDVCGFSIPYPTSCWNSSSKRVVINLGRWVRGAKAFASDMITYRQYAINHEVGHALGNNHVGCGNDGDFAPVMMQQTFGVANNYVAKLNTVDPSNRDAVPRDGKTCKPNAWPVLDSRPAN